MLTQLKAMVVVLFIALVMFSVAKPVCLRFMSADDFVRRRNIWLALTLAAFITPNFWLYVLVALPLLAWGGQRDSNPLALYLLMLHVVPPIAVELPVIGVNQLFDLNQYRILSVAVLVPMLWRIGRDSRLGTARAMTLTDGLLLGYVLLQLAMPIPYETVTNTMRRGFLVWLDVLLLYQVVSRGLTTRRDLVDAIAAFVLASVIAVPIAAFEAVKGWLLYQSIGDTWGAPISFAFLMRGDSLRAQASAGHALALGYMLAVAFGGWLYLRTLVRRPGWSWGVALWMWLGMVAAYSRAPWLVAIVVFLAYMGYGNGAVAKLSKLACICVIAVGVLLVSPLGASILSYVPFGNIDAYNVTYRQRLTEVSWQLVMQKPWFGDLFVMNKMEELRQGQGIIDLVNTYAGVALFHGLIGLSLFVGFFFSAIWKVHRMVLTVERYDDDLARLGAMLVACLVGTMFMMVTGSFGIGLAQMAWVLGAMAVAYSRLAAASLVPRAQAVQRPGVAGPYPVRQA